MTAENRSEIHEAWLYETMIARINRWWLAWDHACVKLVRHTLSRPMNETDRRVGESNHDPDQET